jgi:aspartyl-tRNA(Asn)/glutamyl-tRNA(Gln) amidotransferase subunit A
VSTKKKYTIGVPKGLLSQKGLHEDVISNFKESLEKIKDLGHEVREIDMPDMSQALAVYYILMPAEVSSNLARFDGVKYGLHEAGKDLLEDYLLTRRTGFGKEVRRRILLGTYVLSTGYYDAYYNKALKLKDDMTERFKNLFTDVDLILTPTTPTPAFKIGEKTNDPLEMYLADIFTVTANIVGIPALSVPSGFSKEGSKNLPLGIQFMAPHGGENVLFDIGKKFLGEK